MNFKTLVNGSVLFIGLGLAAYSWLGGVRVRFNVKSVPLDSSAEDKGIIPEEWQVKEGSIYDGDTLRVVRGNEELKIRFCGMQRVRAVRRQDDWQCESIARPREKNANGYRIP